MSQQLQSMTGYARASGAVPGLSFLLEIKSVNARGLDMRMRFTPGYDVLEPEIRRRISRGVSRGSVTVNLNIEREGEGGPVVVNRQALNAVLAAVQQVDDALPGVSRPTPDGILALKGVLEQHDVPLAAETEEAFHAAVYAAVDRALDDLRKARQSEGEHLRRILLDEIDEIARLRELAAAHPGRNRDAILAHLKEQIADLMASSAGLSEEAGSSISSHRNLTAKRIPSAPSPMPWS
jgi:uncharacterized protein (TIGR00255 family)